MKVNSEKALKETLENLGAENCDDLKNVLCDGEVLRSIQTDQETVEELYNHLIERKGK